ncbi:MAG: phospholipase A, partial [Duncaniella sp.]|nr:phospholipase A [Duncaniella sp.]
MRRFLHYALCILSTAFLAAAFPLRTSAQIVNINDDEIDTDSVRRAFDDGPYFGLYKDNYFIFGCPVGQRVTRENSNIKFQISIAQRLTRSTLPWGTYLFLFYSQKCFWNVLENS